ncbi:alpha-N-acetylglucosaminidase-like isoform X4 [Biomphalaria glabrata]|uniref:Alpha-N-acetylglucosaminidase n=1 Tax=Biomphalaria glabrata TaxID=6526 RepID=A0A9W3ADK1_BIOGL|nr:alpha-N-acetylglucosaminidase-like isoform X4 [Biomphalaria glabrata]
MATVLLLDSFTSRPPIYRPTIYRLHFIVFKERFVCCRKKTTMQLLIAFIFLTVSVNALVEFPELSHLKSKTSPKVQAQAVKDLIQRLINNRSSEFEVYIDESIGPKNRNTFQLSSTENGIQIIGTSGVAASMGFYYYLKYYCNGQRTWAGQQTELPPLLPVITKPVKVTTNDQFSYYQNVCTSSYTMAFWNWDRWEKEIDWMALQGINLPLAFVGQEAIFQRVYLSLGFTQADLDAHFGGPAFLAWARMGNIQGWGGPLPQMWITNKLVLQHKILARMRSLGMIPVLPAFAGHVPKAITRVFPNATVTRLSNWNSFNDTYSGLYLLDFQDPLFLKIGQAFIEAQTNEFGTDHIYNTDTFNEMKPASSDPSYIRAAGQTVFNGMVAADPQAVWLMQGWLFLDQGYWKPEIVKALVTSVPQGRMIILDLASDTLPIYQRLESYYGQPFIWCMLHNFGGTMELYGAVEQINKGPFIGRQFANSTIVGIGITPEGIHQNEVMYEFMLENSWRSQPRDVNDWIVKYARQRYGADSPSAITAWKLLMKGVYNCSTNIRDFNHVLITTRPTPTYNIKIDIWYDPEDLFSAWDNMLNASFDLNGSELFLYDITDVTRNSLQIIALQFYSAMVTAFHKKDISTVKEAGQNITNLLADLDHLLSSNERFLLGPWIADAKSWATDDNESKLYEYNARNQITLWGPSGQIHDYASKQWAGVVADYYKPRWQFFTNWLVQLIQNDSQWDSNIFEENILSTVEIPWNIQRYQYPTTPTGNPIAISKTYHDKYRPLTKGLFFRKLWKEAQTIETNI